MRINIPRLPTKPKAVFFGGVALLVLLIAGSAIRSINLGGQSLWIDEGYSINASQAILEHGYPKLDSGKIYSSSLLNTYFIAGSIKIFGLDPYNPWSARLPSVIFGIGIILLSYILTQRLFKNNWLALTVTILITFSLWEIEWSRQARGYTELQFFFLLMLTALSAWLKRPRWSLLILTITSTGAAVLSHPLGVITLPVVPLALIAYRLLHRDKKFPIIQQVFLLSLVIGGAMALIIARLPSFRLYDFIAIYKRFLWHNLRLFTIGSILGIIIGWLDKKRFWPITFLSIALLFPLLIVISYTPLVQMRYLFPLFPLAVIVSVYAVWRIIELIPFRRFASLKPVISVLASIVIFFPALTFTPRPLYHLEPDTPKPQFKEAYAIIKSEKKPDDIVISPYAQLNKIYLGEKGYWLPISLSGKRSDLERTIINGQYDYYVGAPIVKDEEHLRQLLEEENGFIIIDGMARTRLGEKTAPIMTNPNVKEVYSSGGKWLDRIWLHRFSHE